jgi:hypothetical protein
MGYGETFQGFCDCFWSNGRNEFDIKQSTIFLGSTPVFFMHGALHLVVEGDGTTRKLTRNAKTLLEQFGQPIEGDPDARPLLVSEGVSQDRTLLASFDPAPKTRQTVPSVAKSCRTAQGCAPPSALSALPELEGLGPL